MTKRGHKNNILSARGKENWAIGGGRTVVEQGLTARRAKKPVPWCQL